MEEHMHATNSTAVQVRDHRLEGSTAILIAVVMQQATCTMNGCRRCRWQCSELAICYRLKVVIMHSRGQPSPGWRRERRYKHPPPLTP